LKEFTIEMWQKDVENQPVLVSACLIGLRCRYDGKRLDSDTIKMVLNFLRGCWFLPVCPEQLGGLPTVRPPMEIEQGHGDAVLDGHARVIDSQGTERTAEMILGANETYRIAALVGAKVALLKDGSPSCGSHLIKHKGRRIKGEGVTAALLKRKGMVILSEHDLRKL